MNVYPKSQWKKFETQTDYLFRDKNGVAVKPGDLIKRKVRVRADSYWDYRKKMRVMEAPGYSHWIPAVVTGYVLRIERDLNLGEIILKVLKVEDVEYVRSWCSPIVSLYNSKNIEYVGPAPRQKT